MGNKEFDAIPPPGLGRRHFLKGLAAGGAAVGSGLWGGSVRAAAKANDAQPPDGNQNVGFGPTDIGATVGNQRLSVAVSPKGTLSVFRWPSTSYWDQIRYRTFSR